MFSLTQTRTLYMTCLFSTNVSLFLNF